MRVSLGELRRPDSVVSVLCLMDGEVWSPHSVMNNSLSVVPLLEIVSLVLLVSWVELGREDHLVHKLSLLETLVHKEIVLGMHSSMATLARSLEDLESSSQSTADS